MKIEAIINNAKIILQIENNGITFHDYLVNILGFTRKTHHVIDTMEEHYYDEENNIFHGLPSTTEDAIRLSKQMKNDGFKFMGPVIVYSFLEASGFVNDHERSCFCFKKIEERN
jgi:DNA-3-methyladenine glycosylase I